MRFKQDQVNKAIPLKGVITVVAICTSAINV
jgi:hypothetical protein